MIALIHHLVQTLVQLYHQSGELICHLVHTQDDLVLAVASPMVASSWLAGQNISGSSLSWDLCCGGEMVLCDPLLSFFSSSIFPEEKNTQIKQTISR